MNAEFSKDDLQQMAHKKILKSTVETQLAYFKKGVSKLDILRPAIFGDGILKFSEDEKTFYRNLFNKEKRDFKITQFVPASGMSTRMLSPLITFIREFNTKTDTLQSYFECIENKDIQNLFNNFDKLPFSNLVYEFLKTYYPSLENKKNSTYYLALCHTILDEDKLNYLKIPKALFPFHKYESQIKTPFEQHIFTALKFGINNIEFTISEKYKSLFSSFLDYEKLDLNVRFSYQEASTDSIALDANHSVFRDGESLYFHPSGHGALLKNLNKIEGDFIFIKNIDNISKTEQSSEFWEILMGKLIEVQKKTFLLLNRLDKKPKDEKLLLEAKAFLSSEFNTNSSNLNLSKVKFKLNSPIRICGMVKKESRIGGGPFWINTSEYSPLQIIETFQVENKSYLENSTHFNPVYIACSIKNYKGEVFDLELFKDNSQYMISNKIYQGNPIKILELPGLWNGSMAGWNTIFIETPKSCFTPVKTITNLLEDSHQ